MQWEENILLWVQKKVRTPVLTRVMQVITHTTDKGVIWILIGLGMMCFSQTRRDGFLCLLAIAFNALVVNGILKHGVARVRPFNAVEKLHSLIKPPDDFSFPSGHTAVAFAATAAIFFAGYKKTAIALAFYAVLVGFSRIYLGVHYLTDVLAGAFIGVLIAYGIYAIVG